MTINEIIENRTLGSAELLLEVNKYLLTKLNSFEHLVEDVALLKSELFFFTTINNHLEKIEHYINIKEITGLKAFLEYTELISTTKYQDIYNNSKKHFKQLNIILTLTNSKTVEEVMKMYNRDNNDLYLFVMKSHPGGEGEILFNKFKNHNIKSKLIEDYEVVELMNEIDGVVIGADSILATGNVVNKIGSKNLAILCEYYDKPFFVLADSTKKTTQTKFIKSESNKIEIFEEIDSDLITKIITD